MEEKITNLEGLPLEVWEELKRNSETMIRNSKIGFFQGTTLLDLAKQKISELNEKDESPLEAREALKELTDEISRA